METATVSATTAGAPTGPTGAPAVEIRGLVKTFGQQPVLQGVDLTVRRGQIVALLGRNGAGKTTLISVLATLLRADGGTARVDGHDVRTDPDAVRRVIALTGQFAAVDDRLTGRENLQMIAELVGWSRRDARATALAALERFGLSGAAHRRAATYSGGMRRRLDLAAGLMSEPAVLMLDEPTTGLDTVSRRVVWQHVRELAAAGTTVFLTTQYLEEADQLADRIAVLEGGRIVAEGTASQLKAQVGTDVVELRDGDDRLVRELASDGTAADVRALLEAAASDGLTDVRVSIRRPSLDDVFLRLSGQAPESRGAELPDPR
ncbi:ABC transporter ATP-binding protein [Nakamurella leprariae]|uniref:ATP-binding cassette domain-containing protein n=1 Tax=Nakamurella leprariae TaxID=2803911 RepID=A0A938YI66_9ACTN|nr:ATP-binding cassette domain-containing protein [Nakamurella leprariae]MBM9468288.1 ATP-binding cassette domain-containing protein [Nakamurella leprariae]